MKTVEIILDELGGLQVNAKGATIFEVYLILSLASLEAQKRLLEGSQIVNLEKGLKHRGN